MPWSETSPMDQKTQFIADVLRGGLALVELCDDYGISRKTGYKWIDRYLKEGPDGLRDRRAVQDGRRSLLLSTHRHR